MLNLLNRYREAAIHLSRFRFRCGKCSKITCTGCKAEPYHVGKTCEEFKDFKQAKKCRFCNTKIVGGSQSKVPAFANVCRNPDCIGIMNTNCDKKLPCGHFCCGFSGEKICLPCLDEECVNKNPERTLDKKGDDYCIICFT